MKTRLLLTSMLVSFASVAYAAPPVVTGVTASQRTGTKIVDISYNLVLDTGQTAFVELWFSPDNGLTYPIRCMDVNGSVDANVSGIPAAKSVQWNAESDWDQKFTNAGKIRVIATYGDSPSGFGGSGNGDTGGNSGSHDANMKPVPMTYYFFDSSNNTWTLDSTFFQNDEPGATGIAMDPIEVTNGLWNEVVTWATQNGYTGLGIKGGNPEMPATMVSYWEAIKWCNARSEMDGLTPAYYLDGSESLGDLNSNGVIDTGVDIFIPYDVGYDLNSNGKWDPGEQITDTDPNDGPINLKEYDDKNNNGQYDPGLDQIFKVGSVIALGSNGDIMKHTKKDCDGYRLPKAGVYDIAVTGGDFMKSWPWGDLPFPGSTGGVVTEYNATTMHQKYRISITTTAAEFTTPSPATDRQPNGFDLYDVLGNVAEWEEVVSMWDMGGTEVATVAVFGGSYAGIDSVIDPNFSPNLGGPPTTATRANEAYLLGPPGNVSNAIGFRCVVYLR